MCSYDWVNRLYDECIENNVQFTFVGTGNIFIKDGKTYNICKAYQKVMALKSGLQYPLKQKDVKVQKRCRNCNRRNSCNGCQWCGKCSY